MRHRRRVHEREQHQNEIERLHRQRTIMLRRLCSYKRVQLAARAHYFLKQGARADEHELREFARANTPCGGAGG
jgi:hypothetical protein